MLVGRREPYARVTVVWSRSPVSARAGDAALVTSDGRLRGWVGGSCAEPIVVREALSALSDGTPRLVHLAPPGELPPEREGLVVAPVTCASEGSLEVFVDPRLPAPHLVAVGRSPLVEALATMAGAVGFDVTVYEREEGHGPSGQGRGVTVDLAKAGAGPDSFVVVATMGRYDEDAVDAALATGARYVALVASERRARTVLAGVAEEDRARVHAPAGLDLGDVRHVEIAVAILAQIVAEKAMSAPVVAPPLTAPETAIDPVCGMTVEIATAADRFEHEGVTYWFCASGCRRRFERDPAAFLAA